VAASIAQATKISDNVAQTPSAAMSLVCSAGSAVILFCACVTKTRTINSVADNVPNAGWAHVVGGGASGAGYCDIWWNPALASGITTVQLSYSGTTKVQIGVLEVTGLAGTIDATNGPTNNTIATTAPADTVTTTVADDFIVCGCGAVTVASAVASPFFLQAGATGGSGVGLNMAVAAVEELTTGNYTATFTTVSEVSTTAIAAFPVSTGPPPPALQPRRQIVYPAYAPSNYSFR
jgi:hypothetical protein